MLHYLADDLRMDYTRDWTQFHNDAHQTKNFIPPNSTSINEIHVDLSTFICLAWRGAEPLFPSLKRLGYPQEEVRIADPFNLLSPSIGRVDLADVSQDSKKVLALLSTLRRPSDPPEGQCQDRSDGSDNESFS